EAESGEPPYRWSAAGLPSGLRVDPATGTITGVPREAGTFSVNVTVTDSQKPARASTRTLSLTVAVTSGCEDNTSIPDIECYALVEFPRGCRESRPGTWTSAEAATPAGGSAWNAGTAMSSNWAGN